MSGVGTSYVRSSLGSLATVPSLQVYLAVGAINPQQAFISVLFFPLSLFLSLRLRHGAGWAGCAGSTWEPTRCAPSVKPQGISLKVE